MIAIDEIEQMPLHDKLIFMETLWDGISRSEADLEIPNWHKDVLDGREAMITKGEAKFIDWETAKKQIQDSIS
jgi:Putative addiction module component